MPSTTCWAKPPANQHPTFSHNLNSHNIQSTPLRNLFTASHDDTCRQEAMQLLQRREWDAPRGTFDGEDDGPSCEQQLALWAMLCVMNNRKDLAIAPPGATLPPLSAAMQKATRSSCPLPSQWHPCLDFNRPHTGRETRQAAAVCRTCSDPDSSHCCLLCHSTDHGLEAWDLTQPLEHHPSPCPVWGAMAADFQTLCSELQHQPDGALTAFLGLPFSPLGDVPIPAPRSASKAAVALEATVQVSDDVKAVTTLRRALEHAQERERNLQAAHDRSELMSYIKQVVTESMIRHGTCKLGPMLQMEFNDQLDQTPVFRKFMKALGRQQQQRTDTNPAHTTQPNALTLLRGAHLRCGYHGTKHCASIMEHGFDPNKRGANGQAFGPGEYFDMDLSIAPCFSNRRSSAADDADSGVIGCVVIDDPGRVREVSHAGYQTKVLVVDNPFPCYLVETPATLCLPVLVIARDPRSILAKVHASLKTDASSALPSYQHAIQTLPADSIFPTPPRIHDIEFLANDGTWTSMTPSITDFLRNNYNYGTLISTFDADGYPYEVDLKQMKQTNLVSKTVRDVRIVYAPTG